MDGPSSLVKLEFIPKTFKCSTEIRHSDTFSAIVLQQLNNDVKTTFCPKSKRKLTLIGFWKICQDHLEKGLLTIFLIGTQHSNHTAASTQQYSCSIAQLWSWVLSALSSFTNYLLIEKCDRL